MTTSFFLLVFICAPLGDYVGRVGCELLGIPCAQRRSAGSNRGRYGSSVGPFATVETDQLRGNLPGSRMRSNSAPDPTQVWEGTLLKSPTSTATWARQTDSKNELARVKGFGESTGGAAFQSAQPHQPEEVVGREPRFAALAGKVPLQMRHLAARERGRHVHVGIGLPEVAFVLQDLVLEHQVV